MTILRAAIGFPLDNSPALLIPGQQEEKVGRSWDFRLLVMPTSVANYLAGIFNQKDRQHYLAAWKLIRLDKKFSPAEFFDH